MPTETSKSSNIDLRKLLAFGTGVGLEIGPSDLEVAVTRVRPNKIQVLGRLTIEDFATRPAAEWGAEYARFLKACGAERLSATVLLPRREVIVRQLALPGVAAKDMEGAIRFQLETLHPYSEDEVVWGWSALGFGGVLVGIVLRSTIERYVAMFVEAGIAVRSFTFSAAAVHSAIRMNGAGHGAGFVALSRTAAGAVEVYGESQAKPVFSAEFELAPQRAAMTALSELRLPAETEPRTLEEMLPKPAVNPVQNDLSRNALPYATALSGACPWLAPSVNVLPAEYRKFNSRAVFVPTMVLGALLLLVAGSMFMYSRWSEKQYLKQVEAEIAKLEPAHKRADALDRDTERTRARALMLDSFRKQTRMDLDALNEITHLLEPPAWSNSIELVRDAVRIGGETPQTSQLVNILDASPFFEKTEIQMSAPRANGEAFQIRTMRRRGQMNLGTLDRKTAILWVGGVAAILLLRIVVLADRSPEVVTASESVPMAEKRLERLRQIAATVPGKEVVMKLATSELESREKGILKAETSAQAQAQLQDMLHRLGQLNGIDIRGSEDQRVRLLGNDYGEASVTVRFSCLIEQLVNLLAALAAQPELVSTNQIQVNGGPDKNKVIQVRLTLSGVVAKKLAQEKKAGGGL